MSRFDLQEELEAIQDLGNYDIEDGYDVRSMDPPAVAGLLDSTLYFRTPRLV